MNLKSIAFIGGGNMGASLIGGLIKNNFSRDDIWVTDQDSEKLDQLQSQFGIHTTSNNHQAVQAADVIVLAVKPQVLKTISLDIAPLIETKLVVSIAAGIRISSLEKWLGECAIIRCMPNTPALIGIGASALYANTHVTAVQRSFAEMIMQSVGIALWVEDETQLDTVTALSGSGPAYFFYILQSLQHAAVELGLPEETAKALILQTALGAAQMGMQSSSSLLQLQKNVTSPGGTTEAGLQVFEAAQLQEIFRKTLQAAKLRAEELAQLFD